MLNQLNSFQQISPTIHSVDQLNSFFSDKIETLHLSLSLINVNPCSVFPTLPPTFSSFEPASFDEIK